MGHSPTDPDIISPHFNFSHHVEFALRLVEDSPSPRSKKRAQKVQVLTDDTAEHVIRGARSFAARSTRSFANSDTLRPPPTDTRPYGAPPVLGEIAPNNQALRPVWTRPRPSPTPSLKKKKADQILRDHGSPPDFRVTAGGRIVPSDQSPLCSPRYGYSAINKNGGLIRFAPNYPPAVPNTLQDVPRAPPNGFVAQGPDGKLFQMVDGQFLPVKEVNGLPRLFIAAPNVNTFNTDKTSKGGRNSSAQDTTTMLGRDVGISGVAQTAPSVPIQIQALEKEYSKLEQEQRELDKIEVMQRSSMSGKAYAQLVQKRRDLVTSLNDIRISMKALKGFNRGPEISPLRMQEPGLQQQPNQRMLYGGLAFVPPVPSPNWSFDGPGASDINNVVPFQGSHMHPDFGMFMPPAPVFPGYGPLPTAAPPVPNVQPFFNPMSIEASMYPPSYGTATGVESLTALRPRPMTGSSESPTNPFTRTQGSSNDTTAAEGNPSPATSKRSCALEIKRPNSTAASGVGQKSTLNPMSPSYQPGSAAGRASKPASNASPRPLVTPDKSTNRTALAEAVREHNAWADASDETSKSNSSQSQSEAQHSSSASFATADFFPSNPRDHSMTKEAYSELPSGSSVEMNPAVNVVSSALIEPAVTPEKERHNPNWNPTIPGQAFESMSPPAGEAEGQVAPPGTPVLDGQSSWGHEEDPIPNRSELNLSPKSRRPTNMLMKYKSVSEMATVDSSDRSPLNSMRQDDKPGLAFNMDMDLDLTQQSQAFLEGFRAGLARQPVGQDKAGDFLDGYCAGLLKSGLSRQKPADGSPRKQTPARRPSPTSSRSRASSRALPLDRRSAVTPRPPMELALSSMDTLKQVVFAPLNENAILTPDPSGPHVSEMGHFNLGSWAKNREASAGNDVVLGQLGNGDDAFTQRAPSVLQRQFLVQETASINEKLQMTTANNSAVTGFLPTTEPVQLPDNARRVFSDQPQRTGTAQLSYLHRAYPGHRVFSPQTEWKSPSSLSQVAGVATGYFAQFDGSASRHASIMSAPEPKPAATPLRKTVFVEAPMTNDEQAVSAPSSPSKKSISPAKAKFAQIAGKAGIKVRSEKSGDLPSMQQSPEQMTPQEKRRWRDVWKKHVQAKDSESVTAGKVTTPRGH